MLAKTISQTTISVFPYSDNMVKCNFRRLKDKYALDFSIHSLRHTFATRCVENGISYKVIQKWLGHSKASRTLDIYSHVHTVFELSEVTKFNPQIKL